MNSKLEKRIVDNRTFANSFTIFSPAPMEVNGKRRKRLCLFPRSTPLQMLQFRMLLDILQSRGHGYTHTRTKSLSTRALLVNVNQRVIYDSNETKAIGVLHFYVFSSRLFVLVITVYFRLFKMVDSEFDYILLFLLLPPTSDDRPTHGRRAGRELLPEGQSRQYLLSINYLFSLLFLFSLSRNALEMFLRHHRILKFYCSRFNRSVVR